MLVGTCFLNALYTILPYCTSLASFDETCGTIGFVGKGHEVEDVVSELWRVGIKLGYGVDTQRCIVDYLANVECLFLYFHACKAMVRFVIMNVPIPVGFSNRLRI